MKLFHLFHVLRECEFTIHSDSSGKILASGQVYYHNGPICCLSENFVSKDRLRDALVLEVYPCQHNHVNIYVLWGDK